MNGQCGQYSVCSALIILMQCIVKDILCNYSCRTGSDLDEGEK